MEKGVKEVILTTSVDDATAGKRSIKVPVMRNTKVVYEGTELCYYEVPAKPEPKLQHLSHLLRQRA